jgi:hypothetical protein
MIYQPVHYFIDQSHQIAVYSLRWTFFQAIVARIAQQPSEEIGPTEIIHTALFVSEGSGIDLRIHMVIDLFNQIGFNRKRVVQIFSIEILFGLFHKHTRDPPVIELRSSGPPNHL